MTRRKQPATRRLESRPSRTTVVLIVLTSKKNNQKLARDKRSVRGALMRRFVSFKPSARRRSPQQSRDKKQKKRVYFRRERKPIKSSAPQPSTSQYNFAKWKVNKKCSKKTENRFRTPPSELESRFRRSARRLAGRLNLVQTNMALCLMRATGGRDDFTCARQRSIHSNQTSPPTSGDLEFSPVRAQAISRAMRRIPSAARSPPKRWLFANRRGGTTLPLRNRKAS